jgi:hypothetical protein
VEPQYQQYWTDEGFLEGMGREAAGFADDESWEYRHWSYVEDLRLSDPSFFYSARSVAVTGHRHHLVE